MREMNTVKIVKIEDPGKEGAIEEIFKRMKLNSA